VWLTAALYVPVAPLYFFIGTSLFVFYAAHTDLLPIGGIKSDAVFPHFIATQLPMGLAGVVVAAVFAASMDSNVNSMATLTLCDLYKPYFRPAAGERESLRVLHASTVFWGAAGTLMALGMMRVETALDAWWNLAGLFSGGVLGLFLLSLVSRRAGPVAGAAAALCGVLVMAWMALPGLKIAIPGLPTNPLHANMTLVVGTITIFFVGLIVSFLVRESAPPRASSP
jgi:SSS family solute:Na+ symporter